MSYLNSCFFSQASRVSDRGGDLLYDEEIQVQTHDSDLGASLQVWVHHSGHLSRGRHTQWAGGEVATLWLPDLISL